MSVCIPTESAVEIPEISFARLPANNSGRNLWSNPKKSSGGITGRIPGKFLEKYVKDFSKFHSRGNPTV